MKASTLLTRHRALPVGEQLHVYLRQRQAVRREVSWLSLLSFTQKPEPAKTVSSPSIQHPA